MLYEAAKGPYVCWRSNTVEKKVVWAPWKCHIHILNRQMYQPFIFFLFFNILTLLCMFICEIKPLIYLVIFVKVLQFSSVP